DHLAHHGVPCPTPVRARDGDALRELCGRPAAIVTFLNGMSPRRIEPFHCAAIGTALAQLHCAGDSFGMARPNSLGVAGWRRLYDSCAGRADEVMPGLAAELAAEMALFEAGWPSALPRGVIHADLFPDNVFFRDRALSGLIDFYFACTDSLAYDIAVCLNAWCFEPDVSFNVTKARQLVGHYRAGRKLTAAEIAALPLLARGSALRFLLTRLYDWLNQTAGALVRPKDPLEYLKKLRFQRQSRAGRLGRDPALSRDRARAQRRRDADHQQPHGDDGRDRRAGSVETAVPRRPLYRQPISARRRDTVAQALEGTGLADRRQKAGQEYRSVAAARPGDRPP